MSRFVRNSKYRHVYGQPLKRELNYENIKPSTNAHDCNLIKANTEYLSVNWQSQGGGSFAIIPLSQVGKQPDALPLYNGHSAPVLDTDFNPFVESVVASASEDCTVKIWNVAESKNTESATSPSGGVSHFNTPLLTLNGHSRKVQYVYFHPTTNALLLSCAADLVCKLWDVEHGKSVVDVIGHADLLNSASWNYNGSQFATTSKDKKLRLLDPRANQANGAQVVASIDGHQGAKSSRVCWMGDSDYLLTTGFSKQSDRQLFIYNTKNMAAPVKEIQLDSSAGVMMPFYDQDTKLIYLVGKGDGNIRYYEWDTEDAGSPFYLSQFSSGDPQRGFAFGPKRGVDLQNNEIMRGYKLQTDKIEVISFTVPRKSDGFQSDLYPNTIGDEPSQSITEYLGGKCGNPKLISLEKGFKPTEKSFNAVQEEVVEEKLPSNEKEYQDAYHQLRKEVEKLKNEVAQKDVKIRQLEVQMSQLGK
eukprot:NODE_543_length_6231_cov_0.300718.p1 type:complete len:473 gc:universal NODE_543_length_6231_cov_0.300718:4208-2790(-)